MKKYFNRDFIQGVAAAIVVIALLYAAVGGVSALKTFAAKQATPLSDEQQGILAVRNMKASVVNILGEPTPFVSTSTGISITAKDAAVAGTGFVYSSDGLILSNGHVVDDSNLSYTVELADGKQFPAKVLALDKYDDVAILKIEANGLTVAKLGNSDNLETGQTVFAIGNSLGRYQFSVTKGVVSGLGRAVAPPSNMPTPRLQDLIQTDAAISPGNSGGPLIDMAGEVVGMDTLIDTQGPSLGFAIPINTIKSVVSQLQTYGKVDKSYMGVQFATVDGQIKLLENLSVSSGAYLTAVVKSGPASQAGLQQGDVIVAINHEALTQSNELDTVAGKYAPGTQILITYVRNGVQDDTVLILGVLP